MKYAEQKLAMISKLSMIILCFTASVVGSQSVFAGPIHAFYADEHNTTPTTPTGNRILEIDIENMSLVNSLDVQGISGHHVDGGFNSKIYGVPKGSGYVNVIELRKDHNGTTSMQNTKKIDLIHMPRSGDAYNKKFNVVLMVARNRPMGSFINIETDEVVGTIGEDVDCTLTDGTRLLSHSDANTIAGATKYQCANEDHGGDQISGHPYWLTADYAAVVDRTNRQISLYYIWQEGSQLKSRLVNHLKTRTSIHQIIPRDRTNLPGSQKADFYATEEGKHANATDFSGGIAHALIKMKLTTNGLQLVSRMDLQRTEVLPQVKAQRILDACVANYRNTDNYRQGRSRTEAYLDLFRTEGITLSTDQDPGADFPIECFYPGIPGGHNADFAPNNKHLYVGMAGGAMSVIDVNRWKIINNLDIGVGSGPGHTCFSAKYNLALTSNHGARFTRVIRNINTDRPNISQSLILPFTAEGLISTYQSHSCYIDEKEEFYYNFWTDGGVFYKMDLAAIAANTENANPNMVTSSLYTGGIPIQGSYIDLDDIKNHTPGVLFEANYDTAASDGSAVTIDVLANDTGDNLTLESADDASHGQVRIVNAQAQYTPNTGFSGKDGFWYGINSPGLEMKWAFVEVTVNSPVGSTPLKVVADTATIEVNQSITIDLLANDTGTGLSLAYVDDPVNGTASIRNNTLIYTPSANYHGTESFWYKVLDSQGQSAWANVIITVNDTSENIIIDGNDSDWKGSAKTIDPNNNTSLWITDDTNNVYIMMKAQELGANTQFFIDSDSDSSTGYYFWDLISSERLAADLMIQNNSAYQYTGDGESWSWNANQPGVVVVRSGEIIEMSIPKSILINNIQGQNVYIGFLSMDANWENRIGYQNDYITSSFNYTLKE